MPPCSKGCGTWCNLHTLFPPLDRPTPCARPVFSASLSPNPGPVPTPTPTRFANAVPMARAKVLDELLPKPLHPYVAESLSKLPEELCELAPQQIAALPNSFKDEVEGGSVGLVV